MAKINRTLGMLAILTVIGAGTAAAETYHLGAEGDWQNIADTPEGNYLLAVSKIKQQLMTGSNRQVMEALEQLKADFPDLAGEPIDAYIAAEKLYADGKLAKAGARYKQFLDAWPDSALYPVAMERLYAIGVAFLQGQKRTFIKVIKVPAFEDGANLMWDIADRGGNSPIALRALTTLAENQERREQYFDAYQTWAEVATRWPTGQTGQDALLRMAQELHSSYTGPQYDAGALQSARSYYEDFMARYPGLAEQLNVQAELDLILEQLAYKQFQTGFYYERTEKPDVARMYYEKVIREWPDSNAAAMAKMRMEADAPPPVVQSKKRKLFEIANMFLDSWFGVENLVDKMMESQNNETLD